MRRASVAGPQQAEEYLRGPGVREGLAAVLGDLGRQLQGLARLEQLGNHFPCLKCEQGCGRLLAQSQTRISRSTNICHANTLQQSVYCDGVLSAHLMRSPHSLGHSYDEVFNC